MPSLISFSGCNNCSLKQYWPQLKSPKMPMTLATEKSQYKFLVWGEAPGATEDAKNKQFVGETGQYLRKYIPHGWEDKLYFTNSVSCRPPNNRTPEPREISCCSKYREEELLSLKPTAILGLGDVALKYFWPEASISFIRGIAFPVQFKDKSTAWFFPTFHPSYPARSDREFDGKITNTVLPVFKNDLKRFFARADEWLTPPQIYTPPKEFIYPKTLEEARNLFYNLKQPYTIDVETFRKAPYQRDARLLTVAYSDGDTTFAFPVDWPGHLQSWGREAFIEFNRSGRRWIAQGAGFELRWSIYVAEEQNQQFDDLEARARLVHKRRGINSLAELSRIYLGTDIKKVKDADYVDTTNLLQYPLEKVLKYNALDAWGEAKIDPILTAKMTQCDLDNYYRILPTIRSTVAMELRGLDIDISVSEGLDEELAKKQKPLEQKIRALPDIQRYERENQKPFAFGSPKVVGSVMANYCGLQLQKTDKGNYITDDEALQEFEETHPIVRLELDWRELERLRTTYIQPILDGSILGVDGKMHGAYTALHTRTYRLSSYDPNMQNIPTRKHAEIKKQFVAQPGHLMVCADYGQLEGRVICMASRDQAFRNEIINKIDTHFKWLDRIVELYPPYMDRLAQKTGTTKEKEIRKAGRNIIKTDFVFASFYGSIAKSVSERTGIPLRICMRVLDEFWDCYRGVKRWVEQQARTYQETGMVSSLTGRDRDEVLPGNEITNTPSQGTGAEIVLEGQNSLFNISLEEKDPYIMPRLNIHDMLGFFVPDCNDTDAYIQLFIDEMVKPRFDFITVPLMVEIKVGPNFCDQETIGKFEGAYFDC